MKRFLGIILMSWACLVHASLLIPMQLTSGQSIGVVRADNTIYGLLLTPHLKMLPPGTHGFHIHELGMCRYHGMAAGGHYDPDKAEEHSGPYMSGHMGDLPVLIVDTKGNASLPVLAPRLKLADIRGRSLMIHAGSDNYADAPAKLGGGGSRMACGVVPYH